MMNPHLGEGSGFKTASNGFSIKCMNKGSRNIKK